MTQLTVTWHDDPSDTMTIALDPPAAYKGGEIAALEMKEPTRAPGARRRARVRHGDALGQPDRLRAAVDRFSSPALSPAALEALPIGAVNIAAEFLQGFVESGASDPGAVEDGDDEAPPEATVMAIEPPLVFAGVSYAEMELREPLAVEVRRARQLMRQPNNLFESRRAQMALVTAVSGLPGPGGGRPADPQAEPGGPAARPFYQCWPSNWEALIRQLALVHGWPPDACWSMSGTEALAWAAEADLLRRKKVI